MASGDKVYVADKETLDAVKSDTTSILDDTTNLVTLIEANNTLLAWIKNKFFQTYYIPSDTVKHTIVSTEKTVEANKTLTLGSFVPTYTGTLRFKANLYSDYTAGDHNWMSLIVYTVTDIYGNVSDEKNLLMSEDSYNGYVTITNDKLITEDTVGMTYTFKLKSYNTGTHANFYAKCKSFTIGYTTKEKEIEFDAVNHSIIFKSE